jgi:hypothetical protein
MADSAAAGTGVVRAATVVKIAGPGIRRVRAPKVDRFRVAILAENPAAKANTADSAGVGVAAAADAIVAKAAVAAIVARVRKVNRAAAPFERIVHLLIDSPVRREPERATHSTWSARLRWILPRCLIRA